MIYRRFGRTELKMPVFSCGTMRFQQTWDDVGWDKIEDANQANLEAIVKKSFELGINHFETARGYGTSELQLGRALKLLPRDKIIVQTKIPLADSAEKFEALLERSFADLDIDYLDLCGLHGINDADGVSNMHHCLDVLEAWQQRGKIGHLGFSTHDKGEYTSQAIACGRFDYVNLHYYYISQENLANIKLAKKSDMGIFIISPTGKGGNLFAPPRKLVKLTAPFTPMQFNDLFCLLNSAINTLSIGPEKPEQFAAHLEVLPYLEDSCIAKTKIEIEQVADRIDMAMAEVLGDNWLQNWDSGLPDYRVVPDEINVRAILWLYNLSKGLDLVGYGQMRYNLLGDGGTWFPGNKAVKIKELAPQIIELCKASGSLFAERIPDILTETHAMLNVCDESAG